MPEAGLSVFPGGLSSSEMRLGIYQYGNADRSQGLHIGVARQIPRGVRRADYARDGYFDVWMPLVAPSAELARSYQQREVTVKQFFRKYRNEMKETVPRQVIDLLAAMTTKAPIHLGCFCEDETRCHRIVLQELILDALEELPSEDEGRGRCVSPPCSMPDPLADE